TLFRSVPELRQMETGVPGSRRVAVTEFTFDGTGRNRVAIITAQLAIDTVAGVAGLGAVNGQRGFKVEFFTQRDFGRSVFFTAGHGRRQRFKEVIGLRPHGVRVQSSGRNSLSGQQCSSTGQAQQMTVQRHSSIQSVAVDYWFSVGRILITLGLYKK